MTKVVGWLDALDVRQLAAVLFGSVGIVGIVGVLAYGFDPENAWVGLDAEIGLRWPLDKMTLALPAIWSALTLAFAGTGWLIVSWTRPDEVTRWAALAFGALLLAASVDELFIIHERLEDRSGLDWQFIYLPVAAVATIAVVLLLWRLRNQGRSAVAMLIGGGLCWAAASALEYLQWRGDEKLGNYALLMIPEELLELAGSALFALAAVVTLQSVAVSPTAGAAGAEGR